MTGARPAILISSLIQARAALAAARDLGVPVTLVAPPGLALAAGLPYLRELIAVLRLEFGDGRWRFVLDCGSYPGLALSAIRHGITRLQLSGEAAIRVRVMDIARRAGAEVEEAGEAPLDLSDAADPLETCKNWLSERKKAS